MDDLIALTDHDFVKSLQVKQAKMKEIIAEKKQEIAVIEKQVAAVKKAMEAFEEIKYGKKSDMKIEAPAEYSKNLTWSEKVLWATKSIGGGFVENIAQAILKKEPDLNEVILKRMVTQYASRLGKRDNLKYEKIGIKYRYMI